MAVEPLLRDLTGSARVTLMGPTVVPLDEPLVVNETSRASGATYYWPSSDGIEMDVYDSLSALISIGGEHTISYPQWTGTYSDWASTKNDVLRIMEGRWQT
jgi:hypothetical protein